MPLLCKLFVVIYNIVLLVQVLPDDMVVLAAPDPTTMVHAITRAIYMLPKIDPQDMHNRVSTTFPFAHLFSLYFRVR